MTDFHTVPERHAWLDRHVIGATLLALGIAAVFGVRPGAPPRLAGLGADYMDVERFHCQEGAALLAGCCPGFDLASVDCTYDPGSDDESGDGCGSGGHTPDIGSYEYECLRSLSCAEVRDRGLCTAGVFYAACQ